MNSEFPLESNDEEQQPEPVPETEPAGPGSGNGPKPPRPTAIGTGGPDDDDDWAEKRRYELESLDTVAPSEIVSWPLPGLTFMRIDSIANPTDGGEERPRDRQENEDSWQLPRRMYLMEQVLAELYRQCSNLCFCVIGGKTGVNYYMGLSVPDNLDARTAQDEPSKVCYDAMNSSLRSVFNEIDVDQEPLPAEHLKDLLSNLSNHVGIVTGIPLIGQEFVENMDCEQIARLVKGLQGLDFGIMVLAVPIPSSHLHREEFSVLDQMQRAQECKDPEKKRRIKYYLELQDAYLKQIQLGTAIGSWQVGMYFFAPDRPVFIRLRSLIRAIYVDQSGRPIPLRTHESSALKEHLEQFGLLRNTRDEHNMQSLLTYRFLTPLNSRSLSAYVHVPSR